MAQVKINVSFKADIETVWRVVTDLTQWSWRSDLSKIGIVDKDNFVEYTKDGYATKFTITKFELQERYEFDMENENMKGHWTGVFEKSDVGSNICFTEDVFAKKLIMKPFVRSYLKKQQKKYIDDLKKRLGE